MGRKKPNLRDEEGGGGKGKKKALVIDDDEYSIGTEVSVESEEKVAPMAAVGKKKVKQDNRKVKEEEELVEKKVDDELVEAVLTGKKKSKGKKSDGGSVFSASGFGLLGDEENGDEDDDGGGGGGGEKDSEGDDELVVGFTGKKKASKKGSKIGGSLFTASAFDVYDDDEEEEVIDKVEDEDDGVDAIHFMGKKKSSSSGKKGVGRGNVSAAVGFDALGEHEEEKKDEDEDEDEDGSIDSIQFTGKKKSSKSSKKGVGRGSVFAAVGFDALDEDVEEKKDENDDVSDITFSGKKKSSKSTKKADNKFSAAFIDGETDGETSVSGSAKLGDDLVEEEDEDGLAMAFTGKKKSSKKKGHTNSVSAIAGEVADVVQPAEPSTGRTIDSKVQKSEEAVETSKSKKKKKKGGRTAQEEDDLDKILAELGEGPKPPAPSLQEEKAQPLSEPDAAADAPGEKEGEEEKEESAAAKKKKKKKEKEKEKKAAAAAAVAASDVKEEKQEESKVETVEPKKSDVKGKAVDKKVPKHVREMQEALARRKEMEEKKAREEEEKRRKEEEERRRQEELERQAEEARRKKKEKEREKLLRKKLEGKILSAKQKEEQRRLEAMRNQILANAGSIPVGDKEGAPTKRPKYQTKKSRPAHNQNGAASVKPEETLEAKEKEKDQPEVILEVETKEPEKVDEVKLTDLEEKLESVNVGQEDGMEEDDDDEDWDAKSWDDVNLNVKGTFDDEELGSEPESVVKKEVKRSAPVSRGEAPANIETEVAAKKTVSGEPVKFQEPESKKNHPEVETIGKNRRKDTIARKNEPSSDTKTEENLRSPICCIMGHVDTGKTKLLDCIRGTNVQEGEAGGITQQIGATYFPAENIRERTKELKADAKLKVPGLLVIDTPGHESFTNLRSRGSGLCDIAILVVDIMHGLEPQTIESLNLLKMRNTEFIVALNKVDRLYGWKTCRNAPIIKAIKQQSKDVQNEFNMRLTQIVTQFKEQGLNTELYYKNKEMGETFSIVPTSAISGEGIPDLLLLLVQWTQKTMVEKLTFSNEVQCTVLEVKVIEGHGTTIDVVLVNGVLHEGDQIVVCGLQGPIVTTIRALLTPHPMKELRVKGTYLHHKQIKAAQGIKITAQGLEHAIAGTGLYVVGPGDDLEDVKESAMEDMKSVMSRIDKSGEGVYVQASTLGSLEALLEFLKSPAVSIPVSGIGIGPVHKKDVMKASVMLEKKKEYATILAFDVKVTPEARELADELGVKIFIADIIYHLFDQFKAYIDNLKEEKKKEAADEAVFPCVLQILPNCIFNKKDPIVLGVDVVDGIVKVGTPICIPQREFIDIGRIASVENNHKPVDFAKKGQKVAIKIVGTNAEEQQKMFGRHFDHEDELVSHISRRSIDILKANYRDDLSIEEWKLVVKLKILFKIQ
ncbi:hypothetical protein K2173_015548 [Erythroxylum novogranatense]|uniref:Eukaryotic translation initiation factor 5B n=1 Tax=Erythroxylum novogranatense TaxID=1862640 RepID=A0AAV8SRY4_9ROSI|nr:hypothetical protein K2173_015548 [Erythroxylum novogranatense]